VKEFRNFFSVSCLRTYFPSVSSLLQNNIFSCSEFHTFIRMRSSVDTAFSHQHVKFYAYAHRLSKRDVATHAHLLLSCSFVFKQQQHEMRFLSGCNIWTSIHQDRRDFRHVEKKQFGSENYFERKFFICPWMLWI
jgi:hypothetical protein